MDHAVIDTDLHNAVPGIEALQPYLPAYWREYTSQTAFKGPIATAYPPGYATSARPDSAPVSGGPPGSDLELVRQQALDAVGAEYGILNCAYAIESLRNAYAAAALASAVNDWQIACWLEPEPRLRASLVVPVHYPDLAAKEIERLGGHPGFVQVYLPVRSDALYGNRRYFPIYEAALRHDLAVGLHFGGAPGSPPTSSGWPTYYVEEYAGMAHVFQSQLMNLVAEGTFEQFPELRLACLESGFTWLPSFLWRMDKEWKGIRREIPWVKRLPSETIRERVRFSLQPLDAPASENHLRQILEQANYADLLMFSTDYPHWHSGSIEAALPEWLPPEAKRNVLSENARRFYRLPTK